MSENESGGGSALKARFAEIHGHWQPSWEAVLELDPAFFETYLTFAAAAQGRSVLDAKTRQLIQLAVNVQTTTLHEPGIRSHALAALQAGATQAEVMEVLQLVCLLGMHSLIVGLPIMLEEFASAGSPVDLTRELSEREAEVKANFVRRRGYWSERGDALLMLDPDFFEAYADLSAFAWDHGVLTPKLKELIYIAIDAATTHLYEPGLRLHIQNAIRHGATAGEITAVLELISSLGMNSCMVGAPIIREAIATIGTGSA